MNTKTTRLVILLVISRLIIFAIPIVKDFLSPECCGIGNGTDTFDVWSRWDSPHYLYIAEHGYTNTGDEANFIVFFPLYPLLVGVLNLILGNPIISGLLISNLFFILGAVTLYKLVKLIANEELAYKASLALAIFPTSYFFSAPYAESLFLFLVVASLYSAETKSWAKAGVLAGLAAFTRPFGLLLAPSLAITNLRNFKNFLRILLPTGVAFALYLLINYMVYGNPVAFSEKLQQNWYKEFAWPFEGVLSSWKLAFSGALTSHTLLVGWAEAFTTTTAYILIPFACKKMPRSWFFYYLFCLLLFSSTSFILSAPRYLLSVPPIFLLLVKTVKGKWAGIFLGFASITILFALTVIFTSGQWAF